MVVLWIAALLLVAVPAFGEEELPALAVDDGKTLLPLDKAQETLTFSVLPLKSIPSVMPALTIASVRHGGFVRDDLKSVMEPPALDAAWEFMLLPLRTEPLQFAGDYEVVVQTAPAQGTKLAPSRLVLRMSVPPAALRPVERLIVDRTWIAPGHWNALPLPFALEETTGTLQLTQLAFRQARVSTHGDRLVTGRLVFATDPIPLLKRGSRESASYTLTGDFPFGTVTGAIEVTSPQMLAPLSIPFEVRSGIWSGYLGVAMAVGLLLSWYMKQRLKLRLELAKAIVDADPVVKRAKKELDQRKDAGFDAAREAFEGLKRALGNNDAAAIVAAVQNLEKEISTASADFEQRQAEALARIELLSDVVETQWTLPSSIVAALSVAEDALKAAREQARAGLPGKVQEEVGKAEAALAKAFETATTTWGRDVIRCGDLLRDAKRGASPQVSAEFRKRFEPLVVVIQSAYFGNPNAKLQELWAFLPSLVNVYARTNDLFWNLAEMLRLELGAVERGLKDVELPAPKAFEIFKGQVQEAAGRIAGTAGAPSPADFEALLAALENAWLDGLRSQVDLPQLPGIKRLLDNRDYVEAAKLILTELQTLPANQLLGALKLQPAGLAVADRAAGGGTLLLRTQRTTPPEREPFTAQARATRSQIRRAQLLRTLVAGFFACLVGYLMFSQTYVVTPTDAIKAFLWAFGLDVTVDALMSLKPDGKSA